MWKSSEEHNRNNNGPKKLPFATPKSQKKNNTLILPSKRTRCTCRSETATLWTRTVLQHLYPQLIQQTTVTNPIKCSWEIQLNKPSLHAPDQSNLQVVRKCEQSITCFQARLIRKLRLRKLTVTFQKILHFPATIFSNTFDRTGVIEVDL